MRLYCGQFLWFSGWISWNFTVTIPYMGNATLEWPRRQCTIWVGGHVADHLHHCLIHGIRSPKKMIVFCPIFLTWEQVNLVVNFCRMNGHFNSKQQIGNLFLIFIPK